MFHHINFLATVAVISSVSKAENQDRPKILCLHGGGGSARLFASEIHELVNSNPHYDFVFASAGYDGLWIPDPPGGKSSPTTDPGIDAASLAVLDAVVTEQGPFIGILGYSQGSAYVPVYLAHVPDGTFQFAAMFCGYLTETHLGLLATVEARAPFSGIPSLVWMGARDFIISNEMTLGQADKFTNPTIVRSATGGHEVPGPEDPTYLQVQSFLNSFASAVPTLSIGSTKLVPITTIEAERKTEIFVDDKYDIISKIQDGKEVDESARPDKGATVTEQDSSSARAGPAMHCALFSLSYMLTAVLFA